MMEGNIRKKILKLVFCALSNGAIRVWLGCSGAEIYRFRLVHTRKNILYDSYQFVKRMERKFDEFVSLIWMFNQKMFLTC